MISKEGFTFDDRLWPVVIFTRPKTVTQAGVDAFLDAWTECLEREHRFMIAFDFSLGDKLDPQLRQQIISWLKLQEPSLKRWCGGIALVLPSILQRMITQSILFVQPLPVPYSIHKTCERAVGWCLDKNDSPPGIHPRA